MKICILTSCSKRKLPGRARAGELYRGQFFTQVRMLSKTVDAELFILSAKYGLIAEDREIEPYDQRLKTKADARALKPTLTPLLPEIIKKCDLILLLMGNLYESVFADYLSGAHKAKFVLSEDHRGSGGYNQLISQLCALSKDSAVRYVEWVREQRTKISVGTLAEFENL